MGRALEQCFAYLAVTTKTGVFDREVKQLLLGQTPINYFREFWPSLVGEISAEPLHHVYVMNVVTRQATHVGAIMLAVLPIEMSAIH